MQKVKTIFRNSGDFRKYLKSVLDDRLKTETILSKELIDNKKSDLKGFCELCDKPSNFEILWNPKTESSPNYRESLKCEHCKLNCRSRFMISYLKKLLTELNSVSTLYMYEQVTDVFNYVKKNNTRINLIGSEFLGYDKKSGEIYDNIRHEDALNLSFDNESIDIIISNDVFEHVPDIHKTLSDAYRVLKKQGTLLISIPFNHNSEVTKQRAILEHGKIKHLQPEVYHGNPLSEKGSLVFYDYGWDFLNFVKNAKFTDVYMLGYYSKLYGYLGDALQFIFVAKK